MKNFTNLKKRFPKLASVKSIPRKNIQENEKSEKLPEWCQNKVIVDNTIDKVCIEIPTLFRDIIGTDKMQSILEETTKSILQKLRNENKLSPHQTSEENVIFLIS